ncbi:MAG: hypothetical protein LBH50_05715 [Spirochaetaceae bacterium]|jgi:hypothetical protein|nr:hypothetical protein [Spirochaetaceae bacterium]
MKMLFAGGKTFAVLFLAAVCAGLGADERDEASSAGKKLFAFSLVESGSWVDGGHLTNRLDLRLYAPFGLSLRAQAADKRLAPPWKRPDSAITAVGTGVYHKGTGSRLLYGLIETKGLSNRTRNVWAHSVPWFETHSLSTADLKNATGDASDYAAYLELLSPSSRPLNGSFSVRLDRDAAAVFTGMAGARLPRGSSARLEGLITERTLGERHMSQWFSDKPYLPERKFRFYAISVVFTHPFVGFAADFARSEIFAQGTDIYVNAALRVGSLPWRVSIAADGAGQRFSGSDGSATDSGFRTAAKFEWEGRRGMLLRAYSVLRAAAWQEPFDRGSLNFYFRFPQDKRKPVRANRVSLELERDAHEREKITDGVKLEAAFITGSFRPSAGITVKQHSVAKAGDYINPFPAYDPARKFDSVKFSSALYCKVSFVSLNGSIAYTVTEGKEASFASSVGASVAGKFGRIGLKLNNNVKTGEWSYSLSWRLQKTFD